MIRNITQHSAIPTDIIAELLTRHPYHSSLISSIMDPTKGDALNLHTVESATDWVVVENADHKPLNLHTVGSADWAVVENADHKPTIQAYNALRERILPLMPAVNQDGALERAESQDEGQIKALYYLCEYRHDVILSARTGLGKIFQLAPLLRPGICLIISPSPSKTLASRQLRSLDALKEAGAKGLVINQDNNDYDTRRQVARGEFTHGIYIFYASIILSPFLPDGVGLICYITVIISPEFLNSRIFLQEVLQDEQFLAKLVLVAFDELNVAQKWAICREEYEQLHKLRDRIPRSVPWFGTSATLDSQTLEAAKFAVGFEDPIMIRTSIDRPDIFYELREFEVQPGSFEDLRFLLPEKSTLEEARTLPKTIIYFKDSRTIRAALEAMWDWLVQAGLNPEAAQSIVRPFDGAMSSWLRDKISADFRNEDSKARILLVTDAAGMEVGNRGVELIIQYDVDRFVRSSLEMKTIMQRLGRAARGQSEKGHFIWLVPHYVFGPTQPSDLDNDIATTAEDEMIVGDNAATLKKTESAKYNDMADIFKRFFDPARCTRQALLDFFCEPANRRHRNERCCNKATCQPMHTWPSKQSKTPTERAKELYDLTQNWKTTDDLMKLPPSHPPHGWPWVQGVFEEKLREWRQKEAKDLFSGNSWIPPCPQLILPDEELDKLVLMNIACSSEEIVKHFLPEWELCRRDYSGKIVELAQESAKVSKRDGEAKTRAMKEQKKAAEKAAQEAEEERQARLRAS